MYKQICYLINELLIVNIITLCFLSELYCVFTLFWLHRPVPSILVANVNHSLISCRTRTVLQWNLRCSSSVTDQWERGVAGHPSQVPPKMAAVFVQFCTSSCLQYMTMTDSCFASSLLMCPNEVFVKKTTTIFLHMK